MSRRKLRLPIRADALFLSNRVAVHVVGCMVEQPDAIERLQSLTEFILQGVDQGMLTKSFVGEFLKDASQ